MRKRNGKLPFGGARIPCCQPKLIPIMPIPDFQSLMRPLLEAHVDGKEHFNRDLVVRLADQFGLTEEERREMLPSGGARLFDNRIGWAKSHITQAGLLTAPRRAISMITDRGREALLQNRDRIDLRVLNGFEEYREFRNRRKATNDDDAYTPDLEIPDSQTPRLPRNYSKMRIYRYGDRLRLNSLLKLRAHLLNSWSALW